jgi:glycosyltransferase involved in cell wall biosynthesis
MRTLLVGPEGHGGEGVYLDTLRSHPPAGVDYVSTGGFHTGAVDAPCRRLVEAGLNRVVHPIAIPDMGFRALRIEGTFDVVHVHAHPVSLSRLGRTPLVMSEGSSSAVYIGEYLGWDADRLRRGFGRARRIYRALGIADRLLTLESVAKAYVFSEWARQVNVRWGADPEKIEVIPPGFPVQPEAIGRENQEHFTFLFVGGDFERKGGFELAQAFAALSREHPHVRLVLAGTDPKERNPDRSVHSWVGAAERARILDQLAELERRGLVRRSPWINRDRLLREVFPSADVFVMLSHAEGFGFTNVEAMSFGLPVISSTEGPSAEIVDDGLTGRLIARGNVQQLHEAMASMVLDPERTAQLGRAARETFLARFTIEHLQERLGSFYARAVMSG